MNKTTRIIFALSAGALLAAQLSLASAQSAPQSGSQNAQQNAQLPAGKHESGEHMRARWQQADLDKDGQLSKAEAQAAGMKHLANNFDAIDANKDGKISETEVRTWMQTRRGHKHAEKYSPNAQHATAGQAATAPFGKAPAPTQGVAGNPPPRPPRDGSMDYKTPEQRQAAMKERFAKADTNKDGALSKAEAQAAGMHRLVENFDAIDTNKDGKITPEEMRAAWERRK